MENKILFVNACLRENSRTEELSRCLLNTLNGEITEVKLSGETILPLDEKMLKKRDSHDYSGEEFNYAKQFACADVIVVGAPFWDLSFRLL